MSSAPIHARHMEVISRLMIRAYCKREGVASTADGPELQRDLSYVARLGAAELSDFGELANTHHVIVRILSVLEDAAKLENESRIVEWCAGCLATEHAHIAHATRILNSICNTLEAQNCPVAVIKSLDHWPDLGSDLDLYTTADSDCVQRTMQEHFHSHPVERSWGDHLANKWNYRVPGLPELVEIHARCLGQTGEHAEIAQRVINRRVAKTVGGLEFCVPAPEERIVISTLQRVYRHFYFRMCDVIDIDLLLETEAVHFNELKRAASSTGIWPGVATFLAIIQRYVASFGGRLDLPDEVLAAAQSNHLGITFKGQYLRVSKATAATLYASQLMQAGLRGDYRALVRLPLLPSLGVAALVARGLTGSDKGIW